MKLGQNINGYRIVTEPKPGGMGVWAFAEAGGERYFIKSFLSPRRPKPGAAGSPATLAAQHAECDAFEARHEGIRRAIRPNAEGGGNLVVTVDFFLEGSTYYKVTEYVEPVTLPPFSTLEPRQTLTILRTLLFSLRLLHGERVVHSDIKLDNVMYKEPSPGTYVAKLIDFDEAYLAGRPPTRDEIVGDQRFFSPELLLYIKGDERIHERDMTTASDIFSVALLIHLALTGELPEFDRSRYEMACQAALAEGGIPVTRVTGELGDLLERMLVREHGDRPNVHRVIEVFAGLTPESLQEMLPSGPGGAPAVPVAPERGATEPVVDLAPRDEPATPGSRLKTSFGSGSSVSTRERTHTKPAESAVEPETAAETPPSGGSRLKSTFRKS